MIDIFNACFPEFAMSAERFESIFLHDNTKVIKSFKDDILTGFVLIEDFAIRLLCVRPCCQRKGIGSGLLSEAEEYIICQGNSKIITGGVSSGFLIGADERSWGFFEKRGFEEKGRCEEMMIDLENFISEYKAHTDAVYDWYKGDMEKLHRAVSEVEEDWVQYFGDNQHVFAATVDNEIASFCLVDLNVQNYLTDRYGKVGMPGCVGTVPRFRNQGIGLEMVSRATQYLKEEGMDISFIFFTGVARWYEKIGYKTFAVEVFGQKVK